ncbi:MAG: DUF5329 family protein [Colwellia sp.]
MNLSKALILVTSLLSSNVFASMQDEINHLLQYVASTNCQYERNGTKYNGEAAQKHIKTKYQYFVDDIKTTEDFIMFSATKSNMSGKYYKIHCQGSSVVRSQEWLLAELKRYRLLHKK